MTGSGSPVVRRRLGITLRELRVASGKSVKDVMLTRIASKAKMSRLETGKVAVRSADLLALCRFYGVDEPLIGALRALVPGTQQDDWWEAVPEVGPRPFSLYPGLEASAQRIRCFAPQRVPGLLQTEDYSRALFRADLRVERRRRCVDGVAVILGECALRTVVGSADVMAAQLDHLRASAADVRVLPFGAGPSVRDGTWTLLSFADPDDPPVVHVEGAGVARYLHKPRDRAAYDREWTRLLGRAVPVGEWSV